MRMYVCVCMYAYVRACASACAPACAPACARACACACKFVWVCMCMCMCVCVCASVRAYVKYWRLLLVLMSNLSPKDGRKHGQGDRRWKARGTSTASARHKGGQTKMQQRYLHTAYKLLKFHGQFLQHACIYMYLCMIVHAYGLCLAKNVPAQV